jgi:hypothetical protein
LGHKTKIMLVEKAHDTPNNGTRQLAQRHRDACRVRGLFDFCTNCCDWASKMGYSALCIPAALVGCDFSGARGSRSNLDARWMSMDTLSSRVWTNWSRNLGLGWRLEKRGSPSPRETPANPIAKVSLSPVSRVRSLAKVTLPTFFITNEVYVKKRWSFA